MLSKSRPKNYLRLAEKKIIELFHNLFSSGFHLAEIVDFSGAKCLAGGGISAVTEMRGGLVSWSVLFRDCQSTGIFRQCCNLAKPELHGNLTLSLGKIEPIWKIYPRLRKIDRGRGPSSHAAGLFWSLSCWASCATIFRLNWTARIQLLGQSPASDFFCGAACLAVSWFQWPLLSKVIQDSFFQQTSSSAL